MAHLVLLERLNVISAVTTMTPRLRRAGWVVDVLPPLEIVVVVERATFGPLPIVCERRS